MTDPTPPKTSTTRPVAPEDQRKALQDNEKKAAQPGARNFKDDALTDKTVKVEPDGTGPTSTGTFDTDQDQRAGSGSPATGKPDTARSGGR
jgi:hypothetical protein